MELLEILKVLLESGCGSVFFLVNFKGRFSPRWMSLFVLSQICISLVPYFFYLNFVASTLNLFFAFGCVCFFFCSSFFKKIFYFGIYFATLYCSELVTLSLAVYVLKLPASAILIGSEHRALLVTLYMLCMVQLFSLITLLLKQKRVTLTPRQWAMYSMIPLSNFFPLFLYMRDMTPIFRWESIPSLWIILLTGLLGNFILLRLLREIATKNQLAIQARMLEGQLESQFHHYIALKEQIQLTRKYRHDIVNHVETLGILLERGNTAATQAYYASLQREHAQMKNLMLCSDPVMDAMLCLKQQVAVENGIRFEVAFVVPAALPISPIDLIGAVSNLIDNALEACVAVQEAERYLIIQTFVKAKVFVIRIQNSRGDRNAGKSKRLKSQNVSFGIGIDIVREICQKNQGALSVFEEPDSFTSVLSFPLSTGARGQKKRCATVDE